jgi:pimeloyl-ACP methyl ester carboxylesterase
MPATVFQIIVLIAVVFFAGCAPKPTLVVTVGGLGFSQMGDVRRAIQRQCPKAEVVSAGAWDAYKSDVLHIVRKSPRKHLVLVGHSLGCHTVSQTAAKVSRVDLAVLIEPAWDDIRLPGSVERCLWYQRSDFGLVRQAKVVGASPATIKGGHDDVPQSKQLIAEVVEAINGISDRGSGPPPGKNGKPKLASR